MRVLLLVAAALCLLAVFASANDPPSSALERRTKYAQQNRKKKSSSPIVAAAKTTTATKRRSSSKPATRSSSTTGLSTGSTSSLGKQETTRTARETQVAQQAKDQELREAAIVRTFPPTPVHNEAVYQTWLTNVALEIAGLTRTKMGKGSDIDELNALHNVNFYPGQARFPNNPKNGLTTVQECLMYPNEDATAYSDPQGRQPQNGVINGKKVSCELESMRKLNLSPTSNPVGPILDANKNIYVVWEARHSSDTISHLLCPSKGNADKKKSFIRLNQICQLRAQEAVGTPAPGFVPTYGGENEVKYTGIKIKTRSGSRKSTKEEVYGKHFITINRKTTGEEVLRAEGEGANGAPNTWLEFVTGVMPLNEDSMVEIDKVYTCIEKVKGLTPLTEAATQIGRCLGRAYDVIPYPGDEQLPQDSILLDRLDTVKGTSGICQGNYLMPLANTGISASNFQEAKNQGVYLKAQLWAERLVERLLTLFAPPDDRGEEFEKAARRRQDKAILTGLFTIYLFNSNYYLTIDTRADTAKDSWDQLPKAPVMDLVRYLPAHLQGILLAWVKSDGLAAIAKEEKADAEVATDEGIPEAPPLNGNVPATPVAPQAQVQEAVASPNPAAPVVQAAPQNQPATATPQLGQTTTTK